MLPHPAAPAAPAAAAAARPTCTAAARFKRRAALVASSVRTRFFFWVVCPGSALVSGCPPGLPTGTSSVLAEPAAALAMVMADIRMMSNCRSNL